MEKMNVRKHWIDNLRWVTVLLVLLYHVIYFYNNKGVFGAGLVQGPHAETTGAGDHRPACIPLDGGVLQYGCGGKARCF